MQEGDEFSARAVEWLFIDQTHSRACGLRQLPDDVVGAKSDVMNSFAPLSQESGDWTIR